MKKIVLMVMVFCVVGMVGCGNGGVDNGNGGVDNDGYVDLGLPSGTKWSNVNEDGFYTFDVAVSKFDSNLPTIKQWEELCHECEWKWSETGGYRVTGPNGKSITLPAAGFRNCNGSVRDVGSNGNYGSSTADGSDGAWYLGFDSGDVFVYGNLRCHGLSVRLVRQAGQYVEAREAGQYVDLGLPSGTKWSNVNEDGLYTYDEALLRFGDKLPSKKQWDELFHECEYGFVDGFLLKWEEGDNAEKAGYGFTGPNGKSIFLPTDEGDFGMNGSYWSITCTGDGLVWGWDFYGDRMYTDLYSRDDRRSVRLVLD